MNSTAETLGQVQLRSTVVGPMSTNAYLLTDPLARRQVLVDPGDEPAQLEGLLRLGLARGGLDLVVVTHRHADHIGALAAVVARTHAAVAAGDDDVDAITAQTGVPVRRALHHGDRIEVGAVRLDVLALRGHTPGSIALVLDEPMPAEPSRAHLFTGDALFPGGVGSTGGDPSRFAQLYSDVVVRVFDRFDDRTTVRPGHGIATTLGEERPHLRDWRERRW